VITSSATSGSCWDVLQSSRTRALDFLRAFGATEAPFGHAANQRRSRKKNRRGCVLLLVARSRISAQIPLHNVAPNAMEGPRRRFAR